ncbi:MAG: DNA translocase FtsK 4TM domain-containing protein [Clostridia bacterium]|nr:DNA translocase FtsK 4TM domain-containing protein [Clostridia bacterium]
MAKKVVRKKSKTSSKSSANQQAGVKKELLPLISVGIGIFFIISIWFSGGGIIGRFITDTLRGLFGNVVYALPVVLIACAAMALLDNSKKSMAKIWTIGLCPVVFSMINHFIYRLNPDNAFEGVIRNFEIAQSGGGGGVFGALIEPFISLIGFVGAAIVLFIVLAAIVVIIFEISVTELFGKVTSKAKEGFAEYKQTRAEEKQAAKSLEKEFEAQSVYTGEDDEPDEELEAYTWMTDDVVINDTLDNKNEDKPEEEPVSEPEPSKEEKDTEDNSMIPIEIETPPIIQEYIFPTPDLLYEGPKVHTGGKIDQLKANAARLVEIFASFGIETKVTNITRGSSVTRYEVVPAPGIKVTKITALDQDIALRLPANNVRIEVLPGYVGVEVSNDSISTVYLRSIIESAEFKNHPSKLAVAVGKDINGNTVVMDIAKTPHLLIAGATGSGKSVCINTIVSSILYKSTPQEVKLVMVDPKVVELSVYNGIPHLLVPIVTDPRKAAGALYWAVSEMEDRYKKFAELGVRDLEGYNKKLTANDENAQALPQIVIIIDELADLMMVAANEVQDYICRLAQKARAAGMHLILATQRPSVDVITGLIKANIPSRISFAVSSAVDSRTILDGGGAEKLMGKGDMLMMLAGASKLNRVQGAFVSDTDVESVVSFAKDQTTAEYNSDVLKTIEVSSAGGGNNSGSDSGADHDDLFVEAAEVAFELGQVSASMLQRRLKVGYARAGRLIDILDKKRVISTYDGSNKPRTLQMTRQEFNEMLERENEQ